MWWAQAFQVGVSLFQAGAGSASGKRARRLAELNVTADAEETGEKIRRMNREFRYTSGLARAIAAGSGLSQKKGDSQQRYIGSMIAEHGRQIRFEQKAHRSRAAVLRAGGQIAYKQGQADAVGAIGRAIGQFGEAWSMYKSTKD